jgi:hypothetical protein
MRLDLRSVFDDVMKWFAINARSFSYALPDSVELTLYLALAAYFATRLVLSQA